MNSTSISKAPTWSTLIAHDADEQAHNLRNWQQQYDQFSSGQFFGRIQEVAMPDVHLFQEYTSHALVQRCNVQPDSIWFGFTAQQQECRINGRRVSANELMVRPGNCEFELITPDNFNIYGIVISKSALLTCANTQNIDLDSAHFEIDKRPWHNENLDALRNRILHSLAPGVNASEQQDALLLSVLDLFVKTPTQANDKPSFQRRKNAVNKVRQYIQENADQVINISQLCELACMSRRSLQYSFEDVIGKSPLQYLKTVRLNSVRRRLQANQEESQTIASIAAQFGFQHAAQFTADYRQLFGETPTCTLNKQKKMTHK